MLSTMTQDERERLRAEFLRQASEGFDRMFDPRKQTDMRTFTQREDRAMDIGTGLARWALEHHVGEDGQASASGVATTCPDCGGAVEGWGGPTPKAREVESRAGKVPIERPGRFCPRCRRLFFPSGP